MIPFKLFKYIYFRSIIYGAVILTVVFAIMAVIHLIVSNSLKEQTNVLFFAINMIIVVFVNKFVLNKVLFKKYKKITINTDLKSVNIKLATICTLIILLSRIIVAIPCIGFVKVFNLLFGNNLISLSICIILLLIGCILAEYYAINLFLGKYITVSEKNEVLNVK